MAKLQSPGLTRERASIVKNLKRYVGSWAGAFRSCWHMKQLQKKWLGEIEKAIVVQPAMKATNMKQLAT